MKIIFEEWMFEVSGVIPAEVYRFLLGRRSILSALHLYYKTE